MIKHRYLGIDFGERRIGLATCDHSGKYAKAFKTLDTQIENIFDFLKNFVKHQKINLIVVGYPQRTDSLPTEKTQVVNNFIVELKKYITTPIIKIDEAFSSVEAKQKLSSKKKFNPSNKQLIDQIAAQIILQRYLDTLP